MFFRLGFRKRLSQASERTAICALLPKGAVHLIGINSVAFKNNYDLVYVGIHAQSLVFDYFVKSLGSSDFTAEAIARIPIFKGVGYLRDRAVLLFLHLNCVNSHFKEFYDDVIQGELQGEDQKISSSDGPLVKTICVYREWSPDVPLVDDLSRRCAQIEIDVCAAMDLGLSLISLLTLYRVQFPLLVENEEDTYYDSNGRIIYTVNRGLPGVGLPRMSKKNRDVSYIVRSPGTIETHEALGWEDVRDMQSGTVTKTFMDDTLPGGPHQRTIEYVAPFFRPDREEDYRVAWEFFESRAAESESS